MKIESLRLDFLTLIIHINITKAQNISEHIREGRKKKKKKPEEPKPSRATQAVRGPGRAWPRQHAAQVTRGPGSARPGSRVTAWVLLAFFFFFPSFSDML